ncbi:type II 3-dehydroquinate dehydratase [Halonatronomonas betaini]|nr:type II 3-dehydroquinate dehydratase [Halonatronomonas betaini]
MNRIIMINGPNLNWLGKREENHYGKSSLKELEDELSEIARDQGYELLSFQTNSEGEFIDLLQKNYNQASGYIINPGAYSHTSLAIMDALLSIDKKVIEVHLSNVTAREEIRQKLLTASACDGIIIGLGKKGYKLALESIIN